MELFHLIAPKCPGDVGNSDTCKWIYCICMRAVLCICVSTSQPCGSHTKHLHSSSRDPHNIHSVFQRAFFFSKASMVSGCQVILLPVQIMTVIKQLRPERQRGQELAFLTHLNRRQMRIHQGIQTLWLWHMLAPFGTDSSILCQRGRGNQHVVCIKIYSLYIFTEM